MSIAIISDLIYNAALLLALGIIFEVITLRKSGNSFVSQVITGLFLGGVTVAVMINPWVVVQGVIFDTRSIILSVTGMFFGLFPAAIAATMALIYRIWLGGPGIYMGTSVILASMLLGVIWKYLHRKWKHPYSFLELYSLGITTHLIMLSMALFTPKSSWEAAYGVITLPVLILYPLVTVVLGQLIAKNIQRREEKHDLEAREKQFRNLYNNAPMAYQSLDIDGNFVIVNQTWLDTLGYRLEEVVGRNFSEFLHPDYRQHFKINFPNFKAAGSIDGVEFMMIKKDGSEIFVSFNGVIVTDEFGQFKQTQCVFVDITERRKSEAALRSIEWMLTKQDVDANNEPMYGNLSDLNTNRLILDSVGKDVLRDLVSDFLSLMDTSSAVYEKNGDYAIGIFSSAWCQYMDLLSRNLCETDDNVEALACGKWLCHESCWTDVSKTAIETGEVVDKECSGGLRLYAVPIRISSGVIGAVNLGYGSPPKDDAKLLEIADEYHVEIGVLKEKAALYQARPAYIVEQAKRKLHSAARIIGEIVERKLAEEELKRSRADWETIFQSIPHPTLVLDKDQNVLAANVYLEEALGVKSTEMNGKKCWELMHGRELQGPPSGCPFSDSCALDNNLTSEMEVESLGGWYLITCKPIYDRFGNIDKVIHIAMDITARKQTELVLAESEEKYRVLTETAQDSIVVHHFDGHVSYANPTAMEFLGVTAGTLGTVNLMDHVAPEYHNMLLRHSQERKKGFKGSRLYQIELLDRNHQRRQVEVSSTPILANGEIKGIMAVIRDISDRVADQIAMKESEEKYRSLVESSDSSIAMFDYHGVIHFANKAAAQTLGVKETDLPGKHMSEIFPPEIAEYQLGLVKQAIESGERNVLESLSIVKGKETWFHTGISPVMDAQGKPIMAVINATDITAIKQADLALKESQARFEMFMDNLPGGAFIKDHESRTLYVNQYLKDKLGAEAWMGKTVLEYFPTELGKSMLEDDRQTFELGQRHLLELVPHLDGSAHTYETIKFMLPNPLGNPLLGGIAMDVTDRILAEEQRNRYEQRLEILREIDSIVLKTLSFDSVCTAAVENLQKIIPFTLLTVNVVKEAIVTIPALFKPEGKFTYLNTGVPYPANMDYMNTLMREKNIIVNDVSKVSHPSDMPVRSMLIADGINSFMYNAMIMQGELYGFLWFCSDTVDFFTQEHQEIADEFANQLAIVLHQLQLIDKIKEHAEELELKVEERTDQLKTANRELETFSYSVAHDLRSPLRTIDGFCNILLEDHQPHLPPDAAELLNTIRYTTHRMDTLIMELLELAKLNRNAIKLVHVDMNSLATKVSNDVISSKNLVGFEIQVDDIPPCTADQTLITQVWQNLLENAVKFTRPCEVKRIHIGSETRINETVYYVRDSGVGFDMQYVDKIFGAFQRLHRESEFEGTGIGLAIVKKIIERHGGRIWAESTLGKGTSIYFTLPELS
jgi:PAS domain S-box-containing protein